MVLFNWTKKIDFQKIDQYKLLKIVQYIFFNFDLCVVIDNLLYYMKFGTVSATPYSN